MRAITLGETIYGLFSARQFSSGAPYTLAGTPVLSVYEDNNVTQITSGVSISADYDSVTGLNQYTVVATAGNGYEAGKRYDVVITTGTVDSVSVVGEVIDTFYIRSAIEELFKYEGPRGPGAYLNDGASNTASIIGTDGTPINPNSTIASAKTTADALGTKRIYLINNADISLGATMTEYEFVGIGEVTKNVVNLNSQNVGGSAFYNLTLEGTQGDSVRIYAEGCALQDPGAGTSTFNIFAYRCGFVDTFQVDTSADNVFDSCYSLVAGTSAPVITATGASGTMAFRHYSGGIEIETLSASHNVSIETDGQVIFASDCNVNATVVVRGLATITDNTAGLNNLTQTATVNMDKINTEVDTAWTTQMADSVAADGAIPTREQALLEITRFLMERSVSGTTVTVTKEDGSTASMTFTLNDGTNPTSITRAT